MTYVRHMVLTCIALCLLVVALANREPVTLSLLPTELADLAGFPPDLNSVEVPLFIVIFVGIIAGVLLGFVWEWLREHKHRVEAANQRRENRRLNREFARMRKERAEDDDVIALLESSGSNGR